MSQPVEAVEVGAEPATAGDTALRNLYLARFAFAVVRAGALATDASALNPLSGTLLVIYPLFDLGAALWDHRTAGPARPRQALYANMVLSLLTVIGLLVAVGAGIPDALRVWGAWAITAGLVQLVVAVQRYRIGGQLPMVLSGGISVVAGGAFVAMASGSDPSLAGLAGYAVVGGIFFLVSAIGLHRSASNAPR
jgi:uncharacterized membrane protein HdeD (DUF308 family)